MDARTAAAIVAVESAGNQYAVNDNTTGQAYLPASLAAAKALVGRLAGHQLAVGIAQLDSVNFARFGVDAVRALDPCTNLRLGARVLLEDYRREYPRAAGATEEERRQSALRRSLSRYNSGSPVAAPGYARLVVEATASALVRQATVIADAAASRHTGVKSPGPRQTRTPMPVRVAYVTAPRSSVFAGRPARTSRSVFAVEGDR